MSYQSDLLSAEDQKYIFDEVNDVNISFSLFDEASLVINEEESLVMNEEISSVIVDEGSLVLDKEPTTDLEPDLEEYENKFKSIPKPLTNILTNEEYAGPFDFEADVIPNGSRNSWVYSPMLNKVYMDINFPFPIDFKVERRPAFPLFIRITPMYSLPQYAQECVQSCLRHEFGIELAKEDCHVKSHVIRCQNEYAQYIGDKTKNERLSVVIPLSFPQTGTDSVREMFQFICKHSCLTPGMSRRALELIFTLEDSQSQTYGRKAFNVRVCSCPKRDKQKDEKDHIRKLNPPPRKKIMLEKHQKKIPTANRNMEIFDITIPLVGNDSIKEVLLYSQNLMAGNILRHCGNDPEAKEVYLGVYTKIGEMLKEHLSE